MGPKICRNIFMCIILALSFAQTLGQNQSFQSCGLPNDINTLPTYIQDELRNIWRNYVPGNDCDEERIASDDIRGVFDTLLNDEKRDIAPTNISIEKGDSNPVLETRTFAPPIDRGNSSNLWSNHTNVSNSNNDEYYDNEDTANVNTTSTTTKNTKTLENVANKKHHESDDDQDYEDEEPSKKSAEQLPFLKGANKKTIQKFQNVLNDPDIASEQRRQELIHLLAVSYLTGDQLKMFNPWSVRQRKQLQIRENQLKDLSVPARRALKRIALKDEASRNDEIASLPSDVTNELRLHASRRLAARRRFSQ